MQKHLPAEYRAKFAWRQLAAMLRRTDCAELATALQLVLKLEGVTCHYSRAASQRPIHSHSHGRHFWPWNFRMGV
jgi:hypothetical protein